MSEKKNEKIRIAALIVVGILTAYTMAVWFVNYRTLEEASITVEKAAEGQSKNFRHYVREYQTTKVALDESKQKVMDLATELEAANNELSTTRNELSGVQAMNDELKQIVQSLERYKAKALSKGEALETMINTFKAKNRRLDRDLQSVRKELALYQPDIADTAEGRAKLLRFKEHMRMVKANMRILKVQASAMHVEAQKQHDRLEMLYGNNGYMVKDGKSQSLKREGAQVDIKVEFK